VNDIIPEITGIYLERADSYRVECGTRQRPETVVHQLGQNPHPHQNGIRRGHPQPGVKDYILANVQRYYYGLSVDKHVFIDGNMILGIECKAYTENAMIKRILVDFHLLKTRVPNLLCYLFQLESQLGGDYSSEIKNPKGSAPVTTLMSHFPNVDLNIVTLFNGAKAKPADEYKFPKELTVERLEKTLAVLVSALKNQPALN
jgi:hypothetical protein